MPHINQHRTSDGTPRIWSTMDVEFFYGHTVCPDNCETSRVIEDTIATRPAPTTRARCRTTTVVKHEALIPASAMRVALDLIARAASRDPGGDVPDAVGRLLARHETVDSGGDEPAESRRLVTPGRARPATAGGVVSNGSVPGRGPLMKEGSAISDVLLLFDCYACKRLALACPDCVNTVRVDPHTGLPIDLAVVNDQPVTIEPTPQARARSRPEPICDQCVRRNELYPDRGLWLTAAERHRRAHL